MDEPLSSCKEKMTDSDLTIVDFLLVNPPFGESVLCFEPMFQQFQVNFWLFNIAMEAIAHKNRWFSQIETSIYFGDFPWRTVSHNQMVTYEGFGPQETDPSRVQP